MIDGEIHEALIDLADYDPGTDPALMASSTGSGRYAGSPARRRPARP